VHVIKHGNAWKYCYMFTHVSVTEREKGKGLIIKLVSVNMKSFKICGTVYTGCNIDWLVYVHNCIYIWHYMRIICLSFLLWDSLVLATSRVIPGVQLPGLFSILSVCKILKERYYTQPQIESNHTLSAGNYEEDERDDGDSEEDCGETHAHYVGDDEEQSSYQPRNKEPTFSLDASKHEHD